MYVASADGIAVWGEPAAPLCPADVTPACQATDSAVANCFREAHASRWCAPGNAASDTCRPLAAPRPIERIVIHTIAVASMPAVVNATVNQGRVSAAHYYVFRNGCIIQMVREANVAFHVGTPEHNRNTIGIEHADLCNDPAAYTRELYERSAALVRDVIARHRLPLRVFGIHTNVVNDATVIGHSDILPGHHGDPGPYWDWEYYTRLLQWNGAAASRPVRLIAMAASNPATPSGWTLQPRRAIQNDHCANRNDSYGVTFWRALVNTAGDEVVSRFTAGLPGRYKLSMWWPRVNGATSAAIVDVEVRKAGGPARANAVMDQTRNSGRWNDVGQHFAFDVPADGAEVSVRLRRRSPARGFLVSDAVRLLRVA